MFVVGEVNDEESNEKYDIADVRWIMVSLLSLCLLLFSYNPDETYIFGSFNLVKTEPKI